MAAELALVGQVDETYFQLLMGERDTTSVYPTTILILQEEGQETVEEVK